MMLEETLINLFKEVARDENITSDTPIGENIINSINYVKFIVAVEDEFNIEIPDEYLDLSKFNTVKDIALLVQELLK